MTEKAKCKSCTNEKELIEEMAKIIYENRPIKDIWIEDATEIAKVLLSAGYRKPLEGSVVLTKEEYETLVKTAHDKIGDMQLNEFIKACLLSGWAVQSVNTEEQVRKETAKEILQLVKEKSWCYEEDENGEAWTYSITVTELKELAKGYGVEVEDDG